MSDLTPFLFENEHPIRTIERDRQVWFVLADVCRVLEHSNPSMAVQGLDDDEKMTLSNPEGHSGQRGGAQFFTIINESGLYALIITSRKPAAKRFRKWVTAEVLPTIRKTGGYGRPLDYQGQNQALRLMDRLKRDTNPATRRATHAILTEIMDRLGHAVPPLDAIGHDAPPPADMSAALAPFWAEIAALESGGTPVNHSSNPALIALNLNELKRHHKEGRLSFPVTADLKNHLRLSINPAFVECRTVRSGISSPRTLWCWLFRRVVTHA